MPNSHEEAAETHRRGSPGKTKVEKPGTRGLPQQILCQQPRMLATLV